MQSNSRTPAWLVWGVLAAVVGVIGIKFILGRAAGGGEGVKRPLPILNELSSFTLTNQAGHPVRLEDLRGQVWVANIIFTRCPGPCALLSRRMEALQALLPAELPVRLISLTSDPGYDTVEVLGGYARRFHAEEKRWWFLTGGKEEIRRLAVDGLKLVLQDKDPAAREVPEDLFIHSTLMVVVDKRGCLRAAFETMPESEEEGAGPGDGVDLFPAREELLGTVKWLARDSRLISLKDLPAVNASLNALSAMFLLAGWVLIRRRQVVAHRACMLAALTSSVLFLACYLTYHFQAGHTTFQNPAWFRPYYLLLLASHVLLAVVIVPMAWMTLRRAMRGEFERHKRLARWTWPLWMYVSVTGVLIYLILYQIFPQG